MIEYEVQRGQTLTDVAIQVYGSTQMLFQLASDNELSVDSDIYSGDVLLYDDTLGDRITANVIISRGLIISNISEYIAIDDSSDEEDGATVSMSYTNTIGSNVVTELSEYPPDVILSYFSKTASFVRVDGNNFSDETKVTFDFYVPETKDVTFVLTLDKASLNSMEASRFTLDGESFAMAGRDYANGSTNGVGAQISASLSVAAGAHAISLYCSCDEAIELGQYIYIALIVEWLNE